RAKCNSRFTTTSAALSPSSPASSKAARSGRRPRWEIFVVGASSRRAGLVIETSKAIARPSAQELTEELPGALLSGRGEEFFRIGSLDDLAVVHEDDLVR